MYLMFVVKMWVALVACMRKLLTILNAIIRSKTVWKSDSIFQCVPVEVK